MHPKYIPYRSAFTCSTDTSVMSRRLPKQVIWRLCRRFRKRG